MIAMKLQGILAVLTFAVTTHAQLHPDDSGVTCFRCDDNTRDNFPLCLQHPIKCRSGEVCQIRYGFGTDNHIPHTRCIGAGACSRVLNHHPLQCKEGGNKVLGDVCQECCTTSECVSDLTEYLRLELVASKNLFCPGRCHMDDIQQCVHTGKVCDRTKFCRVNIDHADRITGSCVDDHLYSACLRSLDHHPCPSDFKNSSAYDGTNRNHCIDGCCVTNECLFPHFGIHMANATVPTKKLINTNSSGNSSGLWEQLHGSCQDTFDLPLCQSLKNDHDLCRSRLSLAMCPETCGICAAVGSGICQDTSSSLCASLTDSEPNLCDSNQGVFECPTTCGKCDLLLDSLIMSVLNGTVTNAPASSSTPGMTTPNPVDCGSIKLEDCIHIAPLCQTTFLGVVCPEQCDLCADGEATRA